MPNIIYFMTKYALLPKSPGRVQFDKLLFSRALGCCGIRTPSTASGPPPSRGRLICQSPTNTNLTNKSNGFGTFSTDEVGDT